MPTKIGLRPLILMACFFLSACVAQREEVSRITSPDSFIDAVLIRVDAGATAAYAYELHLVPVGQDVEQEGATFRADNLIDFELRWKEPSLLEIHYSKARIFHFSNFWQSKRVDNFRYIVQLKLVAK